MFTSYLFAQVLNRGLYITCQDTKGDLPAGTWVFAGCMINSKTNIVYPLIWNEEEPQEKPKIFQTGGRDRPMKSFLSFTHQNMTSSDMSEMANDDVMEKLIASFSNLDDEVDYRMHSKPGKAATPGKGKVGKPPADPLLLHPPPEASLSMRWLT